MITKFENAMKKLATLGQDPKQLIDCSAVIPIPVAKFKPPTLPAGKTLGDIEVSCQQTPFPSLTADPGPETSVLPVPQS